MGKEIRIAKTFSKKKKLQGLCHLISRLNYKFNGILLIEKKSLKIDSLNTWLIVTEVKRRISGERQCFSTNGAGTWTSTCKKKAKKNLDTDFIPFTKIKSKWITHPSIKCKTTKLLENNGRKISMTLNLVMTF